MSQVPTQFQNILFPGRHHLLTNFQHDYFESVLANTKLVALDGEPVQLGHNPNIIWAITSANHSNTRRNPIPANRREAAIMEFSEDLAAQSFVYPIDDIGLTDRFADHVIKDIEVQSRGQFVITPQNTIVACSTPAVIEQYEKLGYQILPVELVDRKTGICSAARPWDVVMSIATSGPDWRHNPDYQKLTHPASKAMLEKYHLGDAIVELHSDPLVGDEGDITETRDYETYREAFDQGAERKYDQIKDAIVPGRIVDVGCATGSIIKKMCQDERLHESDIYGIEVARKLFDYCQQRKNNGEFENENVFFYQRNIMRGKLFGDNSVDTTTTFSLTHEVDSYLGRNALNTFIEQVYAQTTPGGVWINSDVVGPRNKDQLVLMKLRRDDGKDDDGRDVTSEHQHEYTEYLNSLSTFGQFLRFARDFRRIEGDQISFERVTIDGDEYIRLRLGDACDFMSKKDYTTSWLSEMHERFCYWDYEQWCNALRKVGFKIKEGSGDYRNDWVVDHRYRDTVELFTESASSLKPLDFPVTNMILVAEKP